MMHIQGGGFDQGWFLDCWKIKMPKRFPFFGRKIPIWKKELCFALNQILNSGCHGKIFFSSHLLPSIGHDEYIFDLAYGGERWYYNKGMKINIHSQNHGIDVATQIYMKYDYQRKPNPQSTWSIKDYNTKTLWEWIQE